MRKFKTRKLAIQCLEVRNLLAADAPLISEFMASNEATIEDGFGKSPDWIEIRNPTATTIDLAGWSLTDDPNELQKWKFPDHSSSVLDPFEYLIVFASDRNTIDRLGHLHTNFKISAGGEYIALVNSNRVVMSEFGSDGVEFPEQETDVSYGIEGGFARETVVDSDSEGLYLVPQNNDLATSWTEVDFAAEENGFLMGTAAVGYENNQNSSTSYARLIGTEVPSGTLSTYVRIPFEIDDASAVTAMELDLRFDDGFVAYLNGRRVASHLAPSALHHRSTSTGSRSDDVVLEGETFPLDRFIPSLRDGENVLAFHHLNASRTSSDYLLVPELRISTQQDESGEIRYFDEPTPGGPNGEGFLGFVADTKFSVDRGFYDEPIDVAITSKTRDTDIYYTLDGSAPHPESAASILYEDPVRIERTTNLRAAAFKENYRPTNVDTQTYIFLDTVFSQNPRRDPGDPRSYPSTWQGGFRGDYEIDSRVVDRWSDDNPDNTDASLRESLQSIPTISLTLDHEDLWDRSNGIYPNAVERGEAWRRPGSIEYFDPKSNAEFQYNVGIAMHGSASAENTRLLKHSFRLRFSPQYDGPSRLEFPLFDNSDFADINQLILRAAFTDAFGTRTITDRYSPLDSTYLRDVWMRDAQLATGGTAAQSTYVHLYINGLYWGLYNPAERSTDEQFFTAHFGGEEEDWDIMKDFNELSAGNRSSWNRMFGIARSITRGNADAKFFEIQGKDELGNNDPNRTNYLDMDRFIDYMALHLFAGVEDWPHHNWHAGFNREDPGLGWQFHTWDQEIALDQLVRDRTNVSDRNSPAELYSELLQSPEFRLRFADRIQELFFNDGPLAVENNQARWMQRANQIEDAIIGESARWGDAREGQRVSAYNARSPLPAGTGAIRRGNQTIPLMTVDHWRDSVTYVNETFFPGAHDIFVDRMRDDRLFPNTAAPSFAIDGTPQHGGNVHAGALLVLRGGDEIYFTLDGSDPRKPGGEIQGQRFESALVLTKTTNVTARVRTAGEWSPRVTAHFVVQAVEGDVNGDQRVDSLDIDALLAATRANSSDLLFDLNEDGSIDDLDVDYLVEDILNTRRGDLDLNGTVDFADFLILSANFGNRDEATWASGDLDGDGEIGFSDFLLLSANFGFEKFDID